MPVGSKGSIANAIELAYSNLATNSSCTYYFASSAPAYWGSTWNIEFSNGSLINASTNQPLTVANLGFQNISAQFSGLSEPAWSAISEVAAVSFTQGSSTASDIVISGSTSSVTIQIGVLGGIAIEPRSGIGPEASDIIIFADGLTSFAWRWNFAHEFLHSVGTRALEVHSLRWPCASPY